MNSARMKLDVPLLLPPQVQQSRPPNEVTKQQQLHQTLRRVAALVKEHSLPSPLWILAAPLAQVGSHQHYTTDISITPGRPATLHTGTTGYADLTPGNSVVHFTRVCVQCCTLSNDSSMIC